MFALLALLAFAAVLGLLASVVALVFWVFCLPFRIRGWVFRGFAGLLALPFMLVFAILGAAIFGAGVIALFVPALPFVLLAAGIWWLINRRHPARPAGA